MSDSMLRKSILRKELNKIINNLPKNEIIRQSEIVTEKVLQTSEYKNAKSVSIYLSMDVEIQTESILIDIFKKSKACFIPRFIAGANEMEMVWLKSLQDYYNLPLNKWNIKQPSDDANMESVFDKGTLDLVLLPGLGFTVDGKRLGRGKGYYDKFLEKCEKTFTKAPQTIGLAFKEQILPDIPMSSHDHSLHKVVFSDN